MRSAVDTVVLVMAWSLEVGVGMARARFMGMRGTKRGDPKAAPCEENDDRCGDLIRPRYLPVTRNSGCAMATFFGRALERRIFRRLEPLEGELAVLDPLDGGEPEALELALLVPIGGKNPRPDPQRLPGIGRTGEVGSVGRQWGGMGQVLGLF